MLTVVIIDPDGAARRETWEPAPTGGVLANLQATVGGLVDCVALSPQLDMWINDDGLTTCEPNPAATLIAAAHGLDAQPYFGPAVFTGGPDDTGDTRPLEPVQAQALLQLAETYREQPTIMAETARVSLTWASPYRT